MTALERPPKRPRAFWADVRFFVGVGLIIVSVAGVWLTVTAARHTTPVFAAARTIVPGEEIARDDLRVVEAALGTIESAYLTPEAFLPGTVASRTVAEGEFVPHSALAEAGASRVTTVVVQTMTAVPTGVSAGSTVELWASPVLATGEAGPPAIVVADATVAAVKDSDSLLGARGSALELVIAHSEVSAVLEAVAASASLSVVPTTGGA